MLDKILHSDLSNQYILVDYFPTHGQVLLRRKKNKEVDYNLDIVFKQVRLLFVPSHLEGVELSVVTDEHEIKNLFVKFGLIVDYGYKVFQMIDKNRNAFYINAGATGLFQNRLSLLESSLGEFLVSEANTCLFWYK